MCTLLVLAGCTTLPAPGTGGGSISESKARASAAAGDAAEAARIYAALAGGASEPLASRHRLNAALYWHDAGNTASAREAYEGVVEPDKGAVLRTLWLIATARFEVAGGQPRRAVQTLASIANMNMSLDERLHYQSARAQALYADGEPLRATEALSRRELWLDSDHAIAANHQMIWDGLRASDPERLKSAREASTDATITGWLDLVLAANDARADERTLKFAVRSWVRRYPTHVANSYFVPALLGDAQQTDGTPRQVALLLPLTGRSRSAAVAIRDGFMAAYVGDASARNLPAVRIYDVSERGAIVTYDTAVADGADVVVGPLTKTAVSEMALVENLTVPLLTLNYLPDDEMGPEGLYQFALAPEHEAGSAARRAVAEGWMRAVALVPTGDWGTRALMSFTNDLEAHGGRLLDFQTYDPGETDFSSQIEHVMQISTSVARYRRMRALVDQPLQYEPRRRQDIDFIFLAARPGNARALKPQLRFHYAGDLPVFATSAVYEVDGRSNSALNGIRFSEIPWLIAPQSSLAPTASDMAQHWHDQPQLARLHAMGIDAWRLIQAIFVDGLREPLSGATGILSLSGDGRVVRELKWAMFEHGEPVPLPDLEPPPIIEDSDERADDESPEVWPGVKGSE